MRRAGPDEAAVVGALTGAADAGDGYLDDPGGDVDGAVLRAATARVAEALMAAAEEQARTLGLGTVGLSSDVDVLPAQRLDERLGDVRQRDRDGRIDLDLWVDAKPL